LKSTMIATLLRLGDSTSRNLEFSHRPNVWVSYGEETITESNLLEIRRRHPELVRVRTFPKREEAKSGADWEWHIVGRRRTFKMRVLRVSRFRGRFIGAVYVVLRFNTPSVGGEQDFPPTTVNGHRGCQGFGH